MIHTIGAGKALNLTPDPLDPGVCAAFTMFGATMAHITFSPAQAYKLANDILACLDKSGKAAA